MKVWQIKSGWVHSVVAAKTPQEAIAEHTRQYRWQCKGRESQLVPHSVELVGDIINWPEPKPVAKKRRK